MTPFIVGDGTRVTVLVDAENVRRSRWPNLTREERVERSRAWARENDTSLLVVFDGRPPEDAPDLVRGEPTADDWLAAHAHEYAPTGSSPRTASCDGVRGTKRRGSSGAVRSWASSSADPLPAAPVSRARRKGGAPRGAGADGRLTDEPGAGGRAPSRFRSRRQSGAWVPRSHNTNVDPPRQGSVSAVQGKR